MISQQEYASRRARLMESVNHGVIFLKGNDEVLRNPDVPYEFRQESHFRYLTGIDMPGVSMMLVPSERRYILFAPIQTNNDKVWNGEGLSHDDLKRLFLADEIHESGKELDVATRYNPESIHTLHAPSWFATFLPNVTQYVDEKGGQLSRQLVDMRLVKSPAEIALIEKALDITRDSYYKAITKTRPGINESVIQAEIEYIYRANGATYAFPPIVTQNGNVLHLFRNGNTLESGKMLLIDSGAEVDGYDADITRTFPVNGKFGPDQRDIYNIVLEAKKEATSALRPNVNYRVIHMLAERIIAEGLKDFGILKGNVSNILENGAHRLFFVHGLGHPLGSDDHDCGDFKDLTGGYNEYNPRSDKFGLNSLRYAKILQPGNVMTIEPGVYFIPVLLNDPKIRQEYREFVDFDLALKLVRNVTGIRIEDDILITETSHRQLGPRIPEEIKDLEQIIGKS